jgi:Protein of unknown function (DUF3800)
MSSRKSQSAIIGRTHHMLVSVWGKQWKEIPLAMFTVYIDDSGTAPDQSVAIASAWIIPGDRIIRLENEWNALKQKEGFSSWHTAEFLAKNKKCEAVNWDDPKLHRVFRRVRQIAKKYGVKVVSFAVSKQDYEDAIPPDLRKYTGKFHYTWAVRNVLDRILGWRRSRGILPLEYVFDWQDPKAERKKRREIEAAIDQAEQAATDAGFAGEFKNFTFRPRENIPGLQCSDVLAWTAFQQVLTLERNTPLRKYADMAWRDFDAHRDPDWREVITIRKSELQRWANSAEAVAHTHEWFAKWATEKAAKQVTAKKSGRV